jgi:hypothetical protein
VAKNLFYSDKQNARVPFDEREAVSFAAHHRNRGWLPGTGKVPVPGPQAHGQAKG